MAGGIDVIYPSENTSLYHELCERGTLFSEIKIGTPPQASHFPRRNRLISGLSDAVGLIEAGLKSGSMITADYALSQGREVFAAPGFPLDPRCHGCHKLLREGAQLLTSAEDILDYLVQIKKISQIEKTPLSFTSSPPSSPCAPRSAIEEYILEQLGSAPVNIDTLIRGSSNSTSQVLQAICSLELEGKVQRLLGGRLTRQWKN
jgi:DNA processing protein